jgi:hypothetical protein
MEYQMQESNMALLGDSNPCFRRERAARRPPPLPERLVNVHLPVHFIPSKCLNSRKNKEKSERVVTAFVRVPGRYETGPRYQ